MSEETFFEAEKKEETGDNGLMNMIDEMDKKIIAEVSKGDKVKGKVVSVGSEFVFIDINLTSEAMMKKSELTDDSGSVTVDKGDEVEAYVIKSDEEGTVLSKKMGNSKSGIQDFIDAMESQVPVEGRVSGVNKGGFNVKVMGKQAFCPFSQIDNRFVSEPNEYLAKTLTFVVSRVEKRGRNIVLSRLPLLEDEVKENLDKLKESVESKTMISGKVSKVAPFGLFVDLGIVEGLVHISEVSWDRAENLDKEYSVGDTVDCVILKIEEKDPLKESRISLSMKQVGENPWGTVEEKLTVGSTVEGTITRIAKFGAFVQLIPGVEGLIHNSEMVWDRRIRHASEVVKEGEKVSVTILEINTEKRSVSCTLKDAAADPFAGIEEKYPEGKKFEGEVASETSYGFFIDLDESITGLLVHQNVAKDKKGSIKKGDKIEVTIESVDKSARRIGLSYGDIEVSNSDNSAANNREAKKYMNAQKVDSSDGTAFGDALKQALGK